MFGKGVKERMSDEEEENKEMPTPNQEGGEPVEEKELSNDVKLHIQIRDIFYLKGIMRASIRAKDDLNLHDCINHLGYVYGTMMDAMPPISKEDEYVVAAESKKIVIDAGLIQAKDFNE